MTGRSEARTETVLSETVTADSVVIHDSVYVREAGDTVIMTRWLTRWRERTVHDTVRSHSTDTVVMTETVEKTVEVPKKAATPDGSSRWQSWLPQS